MGKIHNKIVKFEMKNFEHLCCNAKLEVENFEHLCPELIKNQCKKLGWTSAKKLEHWVGGWVDGWMGGS